MTTSGTTGMNYYGDYWGAEEPWEQERMPQQPASPPPSACNEEADARNHYGDYFGLEVFEEQKECMKRVASNPSADWKAVVNSAENVPPALTISTSK